MRIRLKDGRQKSAPIRLSGISIMILVAVALLGCRDRTMPQTPEVRPTRGPATTEPATPQSSESATTTPAASSEGTATPLASSPIRIAVSTDPAEWSLTHPHAESAASAFVQGLITRAPARRDTDGRLLPDLATWQWNDGVLVLTLDEQARWSDGAPITADDVAAVAERAREAGTFAYHIEQITPDDQGTVRIAFDSQQPACAAAGELLLWPVAQTSWPPAATSGEYTVGVLGADRWYLQPQSPALPDVELIHVSDAPTLATTWGDGAVDLILGDEWLMGQPTASGPDVGGVVQVPGPLLASLVFRLDHPIVGDDTVRTALAIATDRAALYNAAYEGSAPLLTALLAPNHWAAPPDGPVTNDRTAAREMLTEAGWHDRDGDGVRENEAGEPLQLTLILPLSLQDAGWERLGPALQRQWADVGVQVEVLYQEPVALEERIHRPAWEVALLAFFVDADPDQTALWSAPEDPLSEDLNVMGYRNATVEQLMTEAGRVAGCDPTERAPLYHRAWDTINSDLPMLVLFPLPTQLFTGPRLAEIDVTSWPPADSCAILPCS